MEKCVFVPLSGCLFAKVLIPSLSLCRLSFSTLTKKKQEYSELNKAQKRKVNGYRLAEFRKTQGVGKASSKKK